MPDDDTKTADGFGNKAGKAAVTSTTEATPNKPLFETAGAIQSNHNSIHEVNPVITENLIGKTDYNPMRMTGNRGNDASDTTLIPESADHLVNTKGGRPTAAEDAHEGRDMAGNVDPSKVDRDTIVTDPVTRITTRVNDATLASDLKDSDNAARAA
jgi:hypothetical protein